MDIRARENEWRMRKTCRRFGSEHISSFACAREADRMMGGGGGRWRYRAKSWKLTGTSDPLGETLADEVPTPLSITRLVDGATLRDFDLVIVL